MWPVLPASEMSPDASAPKLSNTDSNSLHQILSVYPSTLKSFYKDKVKGDDQKREEAHEDDSWRYEQFPAEVQQRKVGQGITSKELERLVKWKITHQTNRPFLLPQIRKNDPKKVEKCTGDARNILRSGSKSSTKEQPSTITLEGVKDALKKVCELTGVGPATGTLILSVFDNDNIPFFEDELYMWFNPEFNGKLKYNEKEYFEMFPVFQQAQARKIERTDKQYGTAEIYEKVAFVCEHWNYVDEEAKTKIQETLQANDIGAKKPYEEADMPKKTKEKVNTAAHKATRERKRKTAGDEVSISSAQRTKKMKGK